MDKVGIPIRIRIPEIYINTNLESVGITKAGVIDLPEYKNKVVWYNLGPKPGEKGNAIIIGHYGWRDSIPAEFDNLHKLNIGDKVYIEDEKGSILTFIVRKTVIYKKSDDTTDIFISDNKKAYLNLITCSGRWDSIKQDYADRLVVFTDID